jgi:hypothetical protein
MAWGILAMITHRGYVSAMRVFPEPILNDSALIVVDAFPRIEVLFTRDDTPIAASAAFKINQHSIPCHLYHSNYLNLAGRRRINRPCPI